MCFVEGPKIEPPLGVILFFNKTTLLKKNKIELLSLRKIGFLALKKIERNFVFFLTQFSGLILRTDTFTKSPV